MTADCGFRFTCSVLVALAGIGLTAAAEGEKEGTDTFGDIPGASIGRMGDSAVVDPLEFKFSDAESSLWLSDHLQNIRQPARLYYEFSKAGSFEEGFVDTVYLDIVKINPDGTKNADLHFFTGERAQPFAPDNVAGIRGNPVLGIYLRGDVHDMNRLTNGNWRHFQRRIKLAFAQNATIEAVTVQFDGRAVSARKFVITPYLSDPHRAQFEQFAAKRYEFVLSDEVPGTIFEIRTVVPDPAGEQQPLIEERLILKQVEYRS